MDAAIEGYLLQLQSNDQTVPGLVAGLSRQQFDWSPGPGRWSIGQCLEHLNLTTERYLPVLRSAASEARRSGDLRPGPFALGLFERLFLYMLEPPPRWRVKTRKEFIGSADADPAVTLERFRRLQGELAGCIRDAEGLDLARIRVKSQFGPISWSLNGTFAILLAHQRRHLWQAREVRTNRAFPSA